MWYRTTATLLLICTLSGVVLSQEAQVLLPQMEWTLGTPGGGMFLSVMGIAPMANGSVVVADKLANALFCLDENGRVTDHLQKRGSGLGAFNGPGPVAVWDKVIAVADFASNRIQVIGPGLEAISEFRAPGSIFTMAFDDEGYLWIGALRGASGETLFKYDREGSELLRRRPQVTASTVFDAIFHLTCTGRTICLVYATRNAIERWDTSGEPLGTIAVSGFPLVAGSSSGSAGGQNNGSTPPEILFVDCAQDGAGRIAILAGDVGMYTRREVFLINKNGEIVAFFTLPERASSIRFVGTTKVLAVENRKTVVTCYELQSDER